MSSTEHAAAPSHRCEAETVARARADQQAARDEESRRWALINAANTLIDGSHGNGGLAKVPTPDLIARAAAMLAFVRPALPRADVPVAKLVALGCGEGDPVSLERKRNAARRDVSVRPPDQPPPLSA